MESSGRLQRALVSLTVADHIHALVHDSRLSTLQGILHFDIHQLRGVDRLHFVLYHLYVD